jgi:hypothetical protein
VASRSLPFLYQQNADEDAAVPFFYCTFAIMLNILNLEPAEHSPMLDIPGIYCFSTPRHGGVGTGNYASMNCTSYTNDDPEAVAENRRRLLAQLPSTLTHLVMPRQVHGTDVAIFTEKTLADSDSTILEPYGYDALVTDIPGVCLAISTADCIPILLYDLYTHAIAAIHAGWRGTVANIVAKTIQTMQTAFGSNAEDLVACIGPGISLDAFEVGDEVYSAFQDAGFDMQQIARKYGKWHLDLKEANKSLLIRSGLFPGHIELSTICSFTDHQNFFSARRLGINSGRILTGILRTD